MKTNIHRATALAGLVALSTTIALSAPVSAQEYFYKQIETSSTCAQPVASEQVVERRTTTMTDESPTFIERTVERPVVIERTIEQPAVTEKVILKEKPMVVKKDSHHLLHLGLFPLLKFNVL